MRRAEAIAKEFNVKMIIAGARQGYKVGDELKSLGAPCLVSIKWRTAPAAKRIREEQPLRVHPRPGSSSRLRPRCWPRAAYCSRSSAGRARPATFSPAIRKAIENGLSIDDALRATTLIRRRSSHRSPLGSLDRGKIANIVITDKPIFDKESK